MRWCAHCNRSFGEQEEAAVVGVSIVHKMCEPDYRRVLSNRIAAEQRHKFLYLPSLKGGGGDSDEEETECG